MGRSVTFDLDAHAQAVMARVVSEESAAREHVVVYLSGAHAYGFPSPDSDLDLKAIHVAPTRALLGLTAPQPTHDRMGFVDGVQIDYTSNELGHAIAGILRGNGNFIERVLGRTFVTRSGLCGELALLVERSLSRRVAQHYRGFAHNQRTELGRTPTVKELLYVLRTTLSGIHLLRSGELVTDVRETAREHHVGGVERLIERKRAGERTPLPDAERDAWDGTIDALFARLDEERERSPLPEEPRNTAELEAWLIETRRARL
jgi:predicted nucleotidyltransferase